MKLLDNEYVVNSQSGWWMLIDTDMRFYIPRECNDIHNRILPFHTFKRDVERTLHEATRK